MLSSVVLSNQVDTRYIVPQAGELGLEIYFISLASPGIDDYSLARLVSDTPSRCILLLEFVSMFRCYYHPLMCPIGRDIDCAFPSREESDDEDAEEQERQRKVKPNTRKREEPPKSAVTLSGLLNVLDSVSSEEGRITFATVGASSIF
jgi:chaperone BCS1